MINKYTFNNQEFLVYSDNEISFPDEIPVILLKENVNLLEEKDIPILQLEQLLIRSLHQKTRIPDKVLAENGIETWNELSLAYFLIRTKQFNRPKRIRDLVEEKYANLIHYIDISSNSSTDSTEERNE